MITTPKPWPELTLPTPAEWLAWLQACTPEEQLELAALVLNDAGAAARCVIADHDHLREELRQISLLLLRAGMRGDRYRAAWHSARRRGWWLIQRRLDEQEATRR